MSPKNLALIAAAFAVMAMGVYLFIQVKSSPAQAEVTAQTPAPSHQPSPITRPTPTPAPTSPTVTQPVQPAAPSPAARPVQPGTASVEPQPTTADESQRANPKLDSMMELANKAYDTQDFDQAIAIAGKVLTKDPTNVRMLRIMVSANCIGGDSAVAQQYYERLPKGADREQMKTRCDRYQVTLKDPP
ncbi:MAG TPA: hypothetical protein VIV40_30745 [Kofleriaceae bacterium]